MRNDVPHLCLSSVVNVVSNGYNLRQLVTAVFESFKVCLRPEVLYIQYSFDMHLRQYLRLSDLWSVNGAVVRGEGTNRQCMMPCDC